MILISDKLLGTVVAVALILSAGCAADPAGDEVPTVVATTSVWGDVVTEIVGDQIRVEVLMPLGADAHEFQPSAAQAALVHRADLVVCNGLGLEEGLSDVLNEAGSEGVQIFEAGDHVTTIPLAGGDSGDRPDPHIWMDPGRVVEAVEALGTALDLSLPARGFAQTATAYADRLTMLDTEMEGILGVIPEADRVLVTNHEALGYFADRYGFRVAGVVIPGGSTLSNPSPADLADLVDTIEAEQVPAIFAETSSPTALARAVAAEVGSGVEVVELYTESLGPTGSGADTLIGMLLTDAGLVAGALG